MLWHRAANGAGLYHASSPIVNGHSECKSLSCEVNRASRDAY
jgi:hypothetical protein